MACAKGADSTRGGYSLQMEMTCSQSWQGPFGRPAQEGIVSYPCQLGQPKAIKVGLHC